MILYRVEVFVADALLAEATSMFANLASVSQSVPGVVHFDILQDPVQPNRFVSLEIYADQSAVDDQSGLPETTQVMSALDNLLTSGPNGMIYHVTEVGPWP